MGRAGDNEAAAPWMPSPEEIGERLGAFTQATTWETEWVAPEGCGTMLWGTTVSLGGAWGWWASFRDEGDVKYLFGALAGAIVGVGMVVAYRAEGRRRRSGSDVTCSANARRVSVRVRGDTRDAPWADLLGVEHHGDEAILCFTLDRRLRLPRRTEFAPVLEVASHIAALRAEHDEQLQERMARGLSRPETDERAERGLSVVE